MANLLGANLNPVIYRPNSFSTANNVVGNPNQFGNFNLPPQLGQGLLGQGPVAPAAAPASAAPQGMFDISNFNPGPNDGGYDYNRNFMSFLAHNMPTQGKGQTVLSPLEQNAFGSVGKIASTRGYTGNMINQDKKQAIINYLNNNFDPYAALMP